MHVQLIAIAATLALIIAPAAFGLAGFVRARREAASPGAGDAVRWHWRLPLVSALLYTLAFNLVFFIQELFLVLPKALTPGLRPTLYHNNHAWAGDNPLAALFQGTGVLATLLVGLACLLAVRRRDARRSPEWQLLLTWMAYCGCLMALPQVVAGALLGGSDVGMAMDYLQLGAQAKTAMALVALVGIVAVALSLRRPLLELAEDSARIGSASARTRFMFRVATLPALAAIVLIVPFRVPREPIEVVMVPLVVTVVGIAWLQSGAWRVDDARATGAAPGRIVWPLAAVIVLLLLFQCVLRPGIAFY